MVQRISKGPCLTCLTCLTCPQVGQFSFREDLFQLQRPGNEMYMTKPVLSVTQPDGSRKYVHPLTRGSSPISDHHNQSRDTATVVGPWAAKMSAEYICANWLRLSKEPHEVRIAEAKQAHIDYAKERGNIGDIVHDIVECWGAGKPYPDPRKIYTHILTSSLISLLTSNPSLLRMK